MTGTPGANILAREADLVIGIGTRFSDFTTASKTAFQNPAVRFININVAEFDAYKHAALPLAGDARVTLEELQQAIAGYRVAEEYRAEIMGFRAAWEKEVDRIHGVHGSPLITQGEVIGVLNSFTAASDILVCAAGSLPGDLHKLWRTRQPGGPITPLMSAAAISTARMLRSRRTRSLRSSRLSSSSMRRSAPGTPRSARS